MNVRCEECKHLMITRDEMNHNVPCSEARCEKANERWIYGATPCYASIDDAEKGHPLYTDLDCLKAQIKKQKKAPKWCPMKEEK